MKRVGGLLSAVVLLCLSGTAAASVFTDDFSSYAANSNLHGQGGWKGWDNVAAAGALVVANPALGVPARSARVAAASDLVHEFTGVNSGNWTFSTDVFIPNSATTGITYFLLLDVYNDGGPYAWCVQMPISLTANTISDDYTLAGFGSVRTGAPVPIVRNAWVPLRIEIDLTNDVATSFYNNVQVSTGPWKTDALSTLNVGAVDLFGNGASSIFYDNVSLVPEPGTLVLLSLGAVMAIRRRRA